MTQSTVSEQISTEVFRMALVSVLEETFERVEQGLFLDKGDSFFETLAAVSAEQASRPVSATCSSIAAQVNHVAAFVGWLNRSTSGQPVEPLDWAATWTKTDVSPAEWQELVDELRSAYRDLRSFATTNTHWAPPFVTGAFGLVAHCAFHLGQIRHALCVVRSAE
jgi:hypothetical protein